MYVSVILFNEKEEQKRICQYHTVMCRTWSSRAEYYTFRRCCDMYVSFTIPLDDVKRYIRVKYGELLAASGILCSFVSYMSVKEIFTETSGTNIYACKRVKHMLLQLLIITAGHHR